MRQSRSAEAASRRLDFLGGHPICMADGCDWVFAGPKEVAEDKSPLCAEVKALLGEIDEAEDEADRRRGEMALAIHLLARNYNLAPADYARLLAFSAGDPRLTKLQDSFRVLAHRNADALRPREGASAPSVPSRSRFLSFRLRRAPGDVGRSTGAC